MKILFVTSEAHPLIKTGGLADVSGSLPKALAELGQDVRLVLPNYLDVGVESADITYQLRVDNHTVNILQAFMPGSQVPVMLVDFPPFFGLPGNPYVGADGQPWPNNAERFALFCRIAVEIAMNRAGMDWRPDIVHCNDWQSGLVPALLSLESKRPATLFTIHNMAYQGLFPGSVTQSLNLPGSLWNPQGLEFFGHLSFIKGGLAYADHITTVSPTYAEEIQTAEFGYGLEGLLSYRKSDLTGIINGIDCEQWNPLTDPLLVNNYDAATLDAKLANKLAIQERLALPVDAEIPVFGLISRLVDQKGIDLLIDCLPELLKLPAQFVILGSGEKAFEQALQTFADDHPQRLAVTLGYDEELAHLIEAGADIFLMPSRFEPCGLNQMYSQRYGTVPIVRKTGGLADTVVDCLPTTIADQTASGIMFSEAAPGALMEAIKRALLLFANPVFWRQLQATGMQKDFSWRVSAQKYLALYENF
ncbi:MAG: glycogen synthase GlgA [Methylobacter sp.]|nr:MAG: glycogen synthase GlgA [Methylobacter sp.]PPD24409.1 MAG: glycogen synthase GlgA [Methylobacter sp.]